MKILSVKVPEELAARLERAVARVRVTKSDLIREFLQRGLGSHGEVEPLDRIVFTLDRDFGIYRLSRRRRIDLIAPY